MPIISSYLYENKFTVQILEDDPTIKTRNRVVYQRPIEIYRGADNPITIYFKNQDQKAANIAGVTFTGYIIEEAIHFIDITFKGNSDYLSMIIDGNTFTALVEHYWKLWGQ